VFMLISERLHSRSTAIGHHDCAVCVSQQPFSQVFESNYFCLFGVRLLRLEYLANYPRCDRCETAFRAGNCTEPALTEVVNWVLAYLWSGFGMSHRLDLAEEIGRKVTGHGCSEQRIETCMLQLARRDICDVLRDEAIGLNLRGKLQVIHVAFLATYACCEIQHEDRLRINLMGTALGLSLDAVEAAIQNVRQQGYYGVQRQLSTQSQAS
jgi:hypothetical protein